MTCDGTSFLGILLACWPFCNGMTPGNLCNFDVVEIDRHINAAQRPIDFLEIADEQLRQACFVAERVKFDDRDSYMDARYRAGSFTTGRLHEVFLKNIPVVWRCAAFLKLCDPGHCSEDELREFKRLSADEFFSRKKFRNLKFWYRFARQNTYKLMRAGVLDEEYGRRVLHYWRKCARHWRRCARVGVIVPPPEGRRFVPYRCINAREKWLCQLTNWSKRVRQADQEKSLFKQTGVLFASLAALAQFSNEIGGVSHNERFQTLSDYTHVADASRPRLIDVDHGLDDVRTLLHDNNHALATVAALLYRHKVKTSYRVTSFAQSQVADHGTKDLIAVLKRDYVLSCVDKIGWADYTPIPGCREKLRELAEKLGADKLPDCSTARVEFRDNGTMNIEFLSPPTEPARFLGSYYERCYRSKFLLSGTAAPFVPTEGYRERLTKDFHIYDALRLNPPPGSNLLAIEEEKTEERLGSSKRST